jgi:hypothetical protein
MECEDAFTSAVRCMQRTRHEYKKAVRRMNHLPPDGFAKALGGENLGSSTPALRFGGRTAPTRPFRGYAQFRLPDFWAFVLESRTTGSMKRLNHCATLGDVADGLVRDVEIAGPAWHRSGYRLHPA